MVVKWSVVSWAAGLRSGSTSRELNCAVARGEKMVYHLGHGSYSGIESQTEPRVKGFK